METSTRQEVQEKRIVIVANIALASREMFEGKNIVPTEQEIVSAKERFIQTGVTGVVLLMDTILALETSQALVGYIGFSLQSPNLYDWQTEETEAGYIKNLMHLPCSSFGSRDWSNSVLRDMVKLSHNSQLFTITQRQRSYLSLGFERTSRLIARATGIGSLQ